MTWVLFDRIRKTFFCCLVSRMYPPADTQKRGLFWV